MKSRVALADDHKQFREAVRNLLLRDPGIEIVGEAGDGIGALELALSAQPDVMVMDIRMPGINGVDLLRQLVAAHPRVKVIVLSVTSAPIFATEMLATGACGYVTKADAAELPHAIHAVANNSKFLSVEVAAAIADMTDSEKPIHTAHANKS